MRETSDAPLKGQVAIVTGSARGLGREYVKSLARGGADVVANDVREDEVEALAVEVRAEGGSCSAHVADVAVERSAEELVAHARGLGQLAIVVNNAGMLRNGMISELSTADIRAVIDVHLLGSIYLARAAFGVMAEHRYGRIVNTSSCGIFGIAGQANYTAAKAGVLGLTTALAIEGAPHGVLVNSVLPNGLTTIADEQPVPGIQEDSRFRHAYRTMKRRLSPDYTAALVEFLASPDCDVTGEHFSSMGGRYARVYWAVTSGWIAPEAVVPTHTAIGAHFAELRRSQASDLQPQKTLDELEHVAERLSGGDVAATTGEGDASMRPLASPAERAE